MELLPINEQKIKIMLSHEDLAAWQLSPDTIDYNTTETRRAFWGILDEAKKKTGFDAAKEKVFVQLYPAKNGGCEMYVTKLGNAKHKEQYSAHRNDGAHDALSFEKHFYGLLRNWR